MTSFADAGLLIRNNHVAIHDAQLLQSPGWDQLVYAAVFGDRETRLMLRWVIGEVARLQNVRPSSIHNLYQARAKGVIPDNFTVPALNLRGLSYDSARAIFEQMRKLQIGPVIFELAKSEMEYTDQSPEEYATVILAAAVRSGYHHPIYLQADHTQLKAAAPGQAQENERARLTHHIRRCLAAGFYNIDIDASTLVDLNAPTLEAQQQANIAWTAELAHFIRAHELPGITVSIGGELGHIGGKNSTVAELEVFLRGVHQALAGKTGLSKVSIQTGTEHGGVIGKSGNLQAMTVDFDLLRSITRAGKAYGVGGSVQHGASTLPLAAFDEFPRHETLEIHLATGWQNLLFDSPHFPVTLKAEIYQSLLTNYSADSNLSKAQYLYRERKRAWGQFKQATWDIDAQSRAELRTAIGQHAAQIFQALQISDTLELSLPYTQVKNRVHSVHDYQGD